MTTKNLKELQENASNAHSKLEDVLSNFEKKLLSLDGVNLPSGFKIETRINSDMNFDLERRNSIRMSITDENRINGLGRPKYFWTMDNYVELKFNKGELTDYDSRTAHGGYHGTEHGNDTAPKIDLITISEILMDINGAQLNLMKLAKSKPEFFIENLQEYLLADKKYEEQRELFLEAKRKNDQEKLISDIAEVKSAFPNVSAEKVDELEKILLTSEKYEESVSIMVLKTPSRTSNENVQFKELNITCKHGDKKSFSATIDGGEGQKRIKASEVKDILSSAITVNGEFVGSVKDLQKSINRVVLDNLIEDLNRSYVRTKHSIPVPMDTITAIAKDLNLEHNQGLDSSLSKYAKAPELEQKNKSSNPKNK